MTKTIPEMVFEAKANTLCARIQHELPRLAKPVSSHPHRIAEAAEDNRKGLETITDLTTEYLISLISQCAGNVGANFDSKYFRNCMSDLVSDTLAPFGRVAERVTEGV